MQILCYSVMLIHLHNHREKDRTVLKYVTDLLNGVKLPAQAILMHLKTVNPTNRFHTMTHRKLGPLSVFKMNFTLKFIRIFNLNGDTWGYKFF